MSEKRVRAYRQGCSPKPSPRSCFASKFARRYKTLVGEIDLVALKGKRLAFVGEAAQDLR